MDRRNGPRRRCRDHHGLRRCLSHFPGKRYESWDDLDDPAGLDTAGVRPIRDDIERRVRQLIGELGLTSTADQRLGRR
jgi:hypothetical protein